MGRKTEQDVEHHGEQIKVIIEEKKPDDSAG